MYDKQDRKAYENIMIYKEPDQTSSLEERKAWFEKILQDHFNPKPIKLNNKILLDIIEQIKILQKKSKL